MEILTEEESRLVMESMQPKFTKHEIEDHEPPRPGSPGQDVLLIHGPGQQYQLTTQQGIPNLNSSQEILIKVRAFTVSATSHEIANLAKVIAVGLNPIDWKGP